MTKRSKFDPGTQAAPLEQRFWSKVRKTSDCWIWIAARGYFNGKKGAGYGRFLIGSRRDGTNRPVYAHRLAWELSNGDIPDGMFVLHKCDNPSCVRPDHLFLGTHDDNMKDMASKMRSCVGQKHRDVILDEGKVKEIRMRYKRGNGPKLAEEYGVSIQTLYAALKGRSWGHI